MAYLVPSKTNVPLFVTFLCKVTPNCTTKESANILKYKKTVVRFMEKIYVLELLAVSSMSINQQSIKNIFK